MFSYRQAGQTVPHAKCWGSLKMAKQRKPSRNQSEEIRQAKAPTEAAASDRLRPVKDPALASRCARWLKKSVPADINRHRANADSPFSSAIWPARLAKHALTDLDVRLAAPVGAFLSDCFSSALLPACCPFRHLSWPSTRRWNFASLTISPRTPSALPRTKNKTLSSHTLSDHRVYGPSCLCHVLRPRQRFWKLALDFNSHCRSLN